MEIRIEIRFQDGDVWSKVSKTIPAEELERVSDYAAGDRLRMIYNDLREEAQTLINGTYGLKTQ